MQHLKVQRLSFTHYNPVVTPKTLPFAGRSTKRDTHHNSSQFETPLEGADWNLKPTSHIAYKLGGRRGFSSSFSYDLWDSVFIPPVNPWVKGFVRAGWYRDFSYALDLEHSYFDCGGALRDVSTVWSAERRLEPGKGVDSCRVIVWCIAKWNSSL